mmetsp:Transcript_9888/g.30515  ORF Transcript_9888/g.30515 Transcript_9888/m.30515 type:complete len:237 (+) Transcript_9888:207-917(+)
MKNGSSRSGWSRSTTSPPSPAPPNGGGPTRVTSATKDPAASCPSGRSAAASRSRGATTSSRNGTRRRVQLSMTARRFASAAASPSGPKCARIAFGVYRDCCESAVTRPRCTKARNSRCSCMSVRQGKRKNFATAVRCSIPWWPPRAVMAPSMISLRPKNGPIPCAPSFRLTRSVRTKYPVRGSARLQFANVSPTSVVATASSTSSAYIGETPALQMAKLEAAFIHARCRRGTTTAR